MANKLTWGVKSGSGRCCCCCGDVVAAAAVNHNDIQLANESAACEGSANRWQPAVQHTWTWAPVRMTSFCLTTVVSVLQRQTQHIWTDLFHPYTLTYISKHMSRHGVAQTCWCTVNCLRLHGWASCLFKGFYWTNTNVFLPLSLWGVLLAHHKLKNRKVKEKD